MRARSMTLPDRLDAASARPLADALLAKRGAPLDLRVGLVERISTASLQVLLSAAVTWRVDGHRLRLTGQSPALDESLRILGLSPDALAAEGNAS